jgi:AraC family transcriptional regulator
MKEHTTTMSYHTTIRETPAIRLAALSHRGDYAQIGSSLEQLTAMAGEMNLHHPSMRVFAIYYDDPSATPRDALRSDACLSVPEGWSPSGRLELREIPGGRYAVTEHVGPYAELQRAYQWLYGTWLAQSGEEPANAPLVEEYLNDVRTVPPSELRTKIWLLLR